MSPSALSYGNVDNDKCRKVISTHTKKQRFLNAYESELTKIKHILDFRIGL